MYGLHTRSNHTQIAAYYLLIISALSAGLAYITGEDADNAVNNIQGIAKQMIQQHEDTALIALVSLIMLGAAAITSIVLTSTESVYTGLAARITVGICFASFALVAYTGYLGGTIRHTELHLTNDYPLMNGDKEREEQEDFSGKVQQVKE